MDKFLETHSPPKLNQEKIYYLNKPITRSKIETVILKNHYKQNSNNRWLHCSLQFYQTYKEELILILLKIFQKIEEEGIPPSFFHEATITLIPKLEKDTTKNYRPIPLKNTFENILNKILAK